MNTLLLRFFFSFWLIIAITAGTAAVGGYRTPERAAAGALAECGARRKLRRLQAACVLYAVGDEIVWNDP